MKSGPVPLFSGLYVLSLTILREIQGHPDNKGELDMPFFEGEAILRIESLAFALNNIPSSLPTLVFFILRERLAKSPRLDMNL